MSVIECIAVYIDSSESSVSFLFFVNVCVDLVFCLAWFMCPFIVGSGSVKYFWIVFSVIIGHVAKYPFLIAFNHVVFVGYPAHGWRYFIC